MIATALLLAFFTKGLCDYLGNYLVSYAGFASVTRLRNAVFDKVLKQDAEFFEAHSTGQLMSFVMDDINWPEEGASKNSASPGCATPSSTRSSNRTPSSSRLTPPAS